MLRAVLLNPKATRMTRCASPNAILLLLLLLVVPGAANAQGSITGFRSPSNNIACQYFDYDRQLTLRCDIMEATVTARRPADCDLDYGHAFAIGLQASKGTRLCAGDTVADPNAPTLNYGEEINLGGFRCRSEKTGMTCTNPAGHGFRLSKARQDLF